MTQYLSGAAFRRALEDRLRSKSQSSNIPLIRLRKTVAFDRYLARLVKLLPNNWVLKGGFGIQLRLLDKARTTKDIDVLFFSEFQDILPSLRNAGKIDLDDWFQFEIVRSVDQLQTGFGGVRFPIQALLDSRTFEDFHIDVGRGDPMIGLAEEIEIPSLLDFADFPTTRIPCYPIPQQIAEKIHAYTRPHISGESSRVKDFVDILLLAELYEMDAALLRQSINATFFTLKTHSLPPEIPNPPKDWSKPYRKLSNEINFKFPTLAEANQAILLFLNPVLRGENIQRWNPLFWKWE